MQPKSPTSDERKAEESSSHLTEKDAPFTPEKDGDHGLLAHATVAAIQVAEDVGHGVKAAVDEAVAWAEDKVSRLSAREEDGTGPYGSPATCAPSDLDPIPTGVLPAMASSDTTRDSGSSSAK